MARERSTSPSTASEGKTRKPRFRWAKDIWAAYQMTRRAEPLTTLWVLGAFVAVLALALVLGLVFERVVYALIVGLPFALLAALFVLARRAEAVAYRRIEGQPGASLSVLRTIRRGWDFPEEPVAMDARSRDLVFRGIGRGGVVLVGEGSSNRLSAMLEKERKRVARVLPNVTITVLRVGDGEDQVPLRKLPRTVQKLKRTLTRQEVAEVTKRMRALGGAQLPLPKGVDPYRARPDRKGLRGR